MGDPWWRSVEPRPGLPPWILGRGCSPWPGRSRSSDRCSQSVMISSPPAGACSSGPPHFLAESHRDVRVLRRACHVATPVDRPTHLSAGPHIEPAAGVRACVRTSPVPCAVCAGGRDPRCGEAATAHRRVSRRHRRLLRPGSDPLAAVGVSICLPARDARAVLVGYQRHRRAEADPEHRRLIVAATYAFSGLQKLNLNFINYEFPWLVEPITGVLPAAHLPLYVLGMAAPFIQVAFAIGLLTKKFRKISLILAVAMHVFVLAMFGPFGHNWNHIVWPWTAAMAVLDLLLFTGKPEFSAREIFRTGGHPYHVCVLVLFAILPFLSFFNLWDSYLSS